MAINARSVLSILVSFIKANPEIGFEKIGVSPYIADKSVLWDSNREKYYHNYRNASFLDMGFHPPIIISLHRANGPDEVIVYRLDVRRDYILLYIQGSEKNAFRRIDLESVQNISFKKIQR